MSAPDTNIEKQTDRHKAPLFGMGAVIAIVGALFVALLLWTVSQGDEDASAVGTVAPVTATD